MPSLPSNRRAYSDRLLVRKRRAEIVPIESADGFFTTLVDKIEAIESLSHTNPISTAVAVATVKRYIPDSNHRIRLHDLVFEELHTVALGALDQRFGMHQPFSAESFQARMHSYEALVERLVAMSATIAYHAREDQNYLLTTTMERLLPQTTGGGGIDAWLNLRDYPALILQYTVVMAALAAQRYDNLAAVLLRPMCADPYNRGQAPSIVRAHIYRVFSNTARLVPDAGRKHTPVSDYLLERLKPLVADYLPTQEMYEAAFDITEFLIGLTFRDRIDEHGVPIGRFKWKYFEWGAQDWEQSALGQFFSTERALGEGSKLLAAAFFNGEASRFGDILDAHLDWTRKVRFG